MKKIHNQPIELKSVDSRAIHFQKNLDDKAGALIQNMLDKVALDDTQALATTIKTWALYRTTLREDAILLVERLSSLNEKQLAVLEGALKKQDMIEKFKSGKISLEQVYNLSAVKNKQKR